MPTYAYSVRDAAGVLRNGTSEAENPEALARRLREQGFQIAEIKQTKAAKKAGGGSPSSTTCRRSSSRSWRSCAASSPP